MADRPMIFSAPMVKALLSGAKTQTRRVMKPQPRNGAEISEHGGTWLSERKTGPGSDCIEVDAIDPPCQLGDRLWVRENCATWEGAARDVVYRADLSQADWNDVKHDASSAPWKLRPSIHMPRWASRITMVVTDVRPERVQDISEEDARAEGFTVTEHAGVERSFGEALAIAWFRKTWNDIHGAGAWHRNDWVWRIAFEPHARNIDRMEKNQ